MLLYKKQSKTYSTSHSFMTYTMANDSYFWFDDDNPMQYKYSHNH